VIVQSLIEQLAGGDDNAFEPLMRAVRGATFLALCSVEGAQEGEAEFITFALENDQDVIYIPLFIDTDEMNEFMPEEDRKASGFFGVEVTGTALLEIVDPDQFLMLSPNHFGIVFQAEHVPRD
jgi:hypothetical protein